MPAYFDSGFVTRTQAWHGLATVMENNPSIDDALKLAGLDWEIEAIPLIGTRQGELVGIDDQGEPTYDVSQIEVPSHRAVIRKDTNAVLGVVSKQWQPYQNAEALEQFRPLVDSGELVIETGGSLQGGKKIWLQARYADDVEVIPGDKLVPYLLIAVGHDGKLSITMSNTPVRVVCWNTCQAAGATEDGDKGDFSSGNIFRVSHTGNIKAKVEQARDALVSMRTQLDATVKAYRSMATVPVTGQQVEEIARDIFDSALITARNTVERLRNIQAERSEHMDIVQRSSIAAKIAEVEELLVNWKPSRAEQEVVKNFRSGPGSDVAGKTAWGLVNAVTHYLDHGKRGSSQSRLASSWFGPGARERQRAFEIAASL